MALTAAILIDGLIYASWLFILSAGLTLIYGVMRVLNMAHGSFYAIGAYATASSISWYFSVNLPAWGAFLILFCVPLVVGFCVGILVEKGLLQFLHARKEIILVLVTYGILLMFEDIIKFVWGVQSYYAFEVYSLLGRTKIVGITFINYDLAMIGVALIIACVLWFGLNRTHKGKLLRAIIQNRDAAEIVGANVKQIFMITFGIGAALGSLAGGLAAPAIAINPGLGIEVIVLAFAVVVIGGLGNIQGALIGAMIIGIMRSTAVNLMPSAELFVIFGVMACVLAFRPYGLFPLQTARKI